MESLGTSVNLLSMLTPKWAATGTGLLPLNKLSTEQFGVLPESMMNIMKTQLPTMFGDYPIEDGEIAANAVLIAVFGVMMVAHLFVFLMDYSRGHKFWISLGMASHGLFHMIGCGLRIKWSADFMQVKVGIASVVFVQTPIMILNLINFYFSTRVFSWRHPDAGRSAIQRTYNAVIYFLVVGMILMAILGQSIPNLYFLTPQRFKMCQQVAQATGVLQIVYSINAMLNVMNAYTIKPGKLGKKIFWGQKPKSPEYYPKTIQAGWIDRFSMFYFVPKGSVRQIYKDDPDADAYRLVSTASLPAQGLVKDQTGPNRSNGSMSTNIATIFTSAVILAMIGVIRCIALFMTGERGSASAEEDGPPFKNVVFRHWMCFLFYGAFEVLISVFWLVMRVDLRFYQPDRPKKRGANDPPRQQDMDWTSTEKNAAVVSKEESI